MILLLFYFKDTCTLQYSRDSYNQDICFTAFYHLLKTEHTLYAIMTDHLVSAWYDPHESEASKALMLCFDSASLEKSCFIINVVYFIPCAYELLCS